MIRPQEEGKRRGALHNINTILNLIARYSSEATLNPGETCEFPQAMEHVGTQGGAVLLDKLKAARVHPYSDLHRTPVV